MKILPAYPDEMTIQNIVPISGVSIRRWVMDELEGIVEELI